MLFIEQIRPELTWRVRQRVMYPDNQWQDMQMEEDFNGYHFGAFKDGWLVAVVSLFQNGSDFQFRKFAVDEAVQHTGIGKVLLAHLLDFAKNEGAEHIWCNARVTAAGFYTKYGFTGTGKIFRQNNIDYEVMEYTFKGNEVKDEN